MKPNVIALSTDAAMLPPAAFLADRLAKLNPRDDTEVVLFCDSLNDLAEARRFGVPGDLRHVQLGSFPDTGPVNRVVYYRLFLPEALGPEVRRVLYLDVDLWVENDSLFRLFDLDMGGYAIGAVRALLLAFGEPYRKMLESMGLLETRKLFNAGVLLIDCERYRQIDLAHRAFELAGRHGADDQRALNTILQGDWLELSPAMNLAAFMRRTLVGGAFAPLITHYSGPWKLWFDQRDPHYADLKTYLAVSPWPTFLASQEARGKEKGRVPDFGPDLWPSIARYVYGTSFADVEQGITPPPKAPAAQVRGRPSRA